MAKPQQYQRKAWQGIQDGATKRAVGEVAQAVEQLARDVLPGIVFEGGILMTMADRCPPGWELVIEMEGRVPLGTTTAALDVGTPGGSMSHTNTIASQAATNTGATALDAHTHTIANSGTHDHGIGATTSSRDNTGASPGSVVSTISNNTDPGGNHSHGGATGVTTGTSHTHAIAAHDHGAVTGSADHTPANVKVLFCRRIQQEGR